MLNGTSESCVYCGIAQCCLQNRRQSCCWKAILCLPFSTHLKMSVCILQTWLRIDGEQEFQNCGCGTATKVVRSKPDWPDQWLRACTSSHTLRKMLWQRGSRLNMVLIKHTYVIMFHFHTLSFLFCTVHMTGQGYGSYCTSMFKLSSSQKCGLAVWKLMTKGNWHTRTKEEVSNTKVDLTTCTCS